MQAIGSTVTYLERYTLKAITGVSEEGDDNDGRLPMNKTEQDLYDDWVSQIPKCNTEDEVIALGEEAKVYLMRMNRTSEWLDYIGKLKTRREEITLEAKS